MFLQENYLLKKATYGSLTTLSDEEFNTFYKTTGLKLDNRHEMMEGMTKHIEYAVTKFVQYAKAIPGFSSLPIEDQANLIKSKTTVKPVLCDHIKQDIFLAFQTGDSLLLLSVTTFIQQ